MATAYTFDMNEPYVPKTRASDVSRAKGRGTPVAQRRGAPGRRSIAGPQGAGVPDQDCAATTKRAAFNAPDRIRTDPGRASSRAGCEDAPSPSGAVRVRDPNSSGSASGRGLGRPNMAAAMVVRSDSAPARPGGAASSTGADGNRSITGPAA